VLAQHQHVVKGEQLGSPMAEVVPAWERLRAALRLTQERRGARSPKRVTHSLTLSQRTDSPSERARIPIHLLHALRLPPQQEAQRVVVEHRGRKRHPVRHRGRNVPLLEAEPASRLLTCAERVGPVARPAAQKRGRSVAERGVHKTASIVACALTSSGSVVRDARCAMLCAPAGRAGR
jgi:hypothetical protein